MHLLGTCTPQVSLLVLVLAAMPISLIGRELRTKLFCQHAGPDLPKPGRNPADFTQTQTIVDRMITSTASKPNLCCGSKPFNTDDKMCCYGKVLEKESIRCCLDGNFLPKESVCRCHPSSPWLVTELERLAKVEARHTDFDDDFSNLITHVKEKMQVIEREIQRMDVRANDLYNIVLDFTKINDDWDAQEANYIISLIVFRNAVEESLEVSTSGSDRADAGKLPPDSLKRLTKYSINSNPHDIVELANNVLLKMRTDASVVGIVLEREQLLASISARHAQLSHDAQLLDNLLRVHEVSLNDLYLLGTFRRMLDDVMYRVLQMEAAFRREYPEYARRPPRRDLSIEDLRASLRQTIAEDPLALADELGSSEAKIQTLSVRACDFAAWNEYVSSFERRADLIASDIELFRSGDQPMSGMRSLAHFWNSESAMFKGTVTSAPSKITN